MIFLTGSKYGTGPPQQEKMTKYTGPAQDTFFSSTVVQIIYSNMQYTAAIATQFHTFLPSKTPPPTAMQALALSFILKTALTTMACLWLLRKRKNLTITCKHIQPRSVPGQPPASSSPPKICAGHQSIP